MSDGGTYGARNWLVIFVLVLPSVLFALVFALINLLVVSFICLLVALLYWQFAHRTVVVSGAEVKLYGAVQVITVERATITEVEPGTTGYALRGYGWQVGIANFLFPAPGDRKGSAADRRSQLMENFMIGEGGGTRGEPARAVRWPSASTSLAFAAVAAMCIVLALP